MLTVVGVTTHVVETTSPFELVTVSVYVLVEVSAGVGYDAPVTAEAVISELPTPVEPMTAVPPEKVGTSVTGALYGGVDVLGTRLEANGVVLCTVRVAEALVTTPAEFDTVTV
jgi:hypothetical protein